MLAVSAETVRTHVGAIQAALDVSNRVEAAAVYLARESEPAQVDTVLARPALAVLRSRPPKATRSRARPRPA